MRSTVLHVDRTELLDALQSLARVASPARSGQAILRYEDGMLSIAIGGGEMLVPARGHWPGEARAPGGLVLALANDAPQVDPLPLFIEDGRLRVGADFAVPCRWQPLRSATVQLPVDASPVDVLRVILDETDEALELSGILLQAKEARALRDGLVEQAVKILEPLYVRGEDVREMIERRLRWLNSQP